MAYIELTKTQLEELAAGLVDCIALEDNQGGCITVYAKEDSDEDN